MEKTKYLFDESDMYGGEKDGFGKFQIDLFHVLLTDEKFFNEIIEDIEGYTFKDGLMRNLVNALKDMYSLDKHMPSIDNLKLYIKMHTKNKIDVESIYDFIEQSIEINVTDERVEEVKNWFKYYNMFCMYLACGNHILMTIKDGFPTPNAFLKGVEDLFDRADALYSHYNYFKEKYADEKQSKTADDWD